MSKCCVWSHERRSFFILADNSRLLLYLHLARTTNFCFVSIVFDANKALLFLIVRACFIEVRLLPIFDDDTIFEVFEGFDHSLKLSFVDCRVAFFRELGGIKLFKRDVSDCLDNVIGCSDSTQIDPIAHFKEEAETKRCDIFRLHGKRAQVVGSHCSRV